MKLLASFLLVLFAGAASAKTCTATLNGTLKYKTFNFPLTKVYYPDDSGVSKLAEWKGEVVTRKFILPDPITIECGKPYFQASFSKFRATGMLPPQIQTYAWTRLDYSGTPRIIAPETIYGFGDSSDYPYPATFFEGTNDLMIDEPAPAGVKDICDVPKLPLTTIVRENVLIQPDPLTAKYSQPSEWGSYTWDPSSSPAFENVELELDEAWVNITCDTQWKYEATFQWPFVIPSDHDSMCGPGEVHREMKMEGDFYMTKDNEVFGYIKVSKPTVTYSGNVKGEYYGSSFSLPLEGSYIEDSSGKKTVLLPIFEGGDGISWSYTLMCPYGNISNTLFGAASHYFQIMMEQEELSSEEGGFFKLEADGDEKTFNVDMGGQGQVTIKRNWKKI